jgi:DNA-binding NtrC family response regulator
MDSFRLLVVDDEEDFLETLVKRLNKRNIDATGVPSGPGIEVIILSGHASVDAAMDGMKLGAYEYLLKPCEIEELIEKIDRAYELKADRDKRVRKAEIRKMIEK